MSKKFGFTLIELLIVITIIAILAAIGLVTYSSFTQRARDAKRQADLKFIQSGLEQYHADQKHYPYKIAFGCADCELSYGGKKYITKIPSDPKGNPNYAYSASGPTNCTSSSNQTGCTSYCLFTRIEGKSIPTSDPGCTTFPSGGYNFGITKP